MKTYDSPKQKLSEHFTGCLSHKRVEELQQELVQMRNEWNREPFDYTEWQQNLFEGMSVRELSKIAMQK